jgi:polar amino acid transport system permease protein
LGIPGLQISWLPNSAVLLGTVSLVLTYSAYVAEVIRAGIEAVNPAQRMAARALGFTQSQTQRFVILPQALRKVTPPLLNDLVSLQKDSGLISVLGAIDAIRAAGIQTAQSFNFTPYLVAGALFVALTIPLTRFTDWLTRRQDRARQQQGQW